MGTVGGAIRRAEELESQCADTAIEASDDPRTLPIFPIGAFTPASTCPHRGPLPSGLRPTVCMVCHDTSL